MKIFVGASNRKAMDPDKLRVPVPDTLEVIIEDFVGFIKKYASNISKGGVFVATDRPIEGSQQLRIHFRLEDNYTLIRALGSVVWIRAQDESPSRPAGMGIRFDWLDEESQRLIDKIVSNFIKEGGRPFKLEETAPAGTVIPPRSEPPVSPEEAFAEAEAGEAEEMKDEASLALERALGSSSGGGSAEDESLGGLEASATFAPGIDRSEGTPEGSDELPRAAFSESVASSLEADPGQAPLTPPPISIDQALGAVADPLADVGPAPDPIAGTSLDPPDAPLPFDLPQPGAPSAGPDPSLPDSALDDDDIELNFDVIDPRVEEPASGEPAGLDLGSGLDLDLDLDGASDLGLDLGQSPAASEDLASELGDLGTPDATDTSDQDFADRLDSALDSALPDGGAGPMFEMASTPEWPPAEGGPEPEPQGPEMPADSLLGGAELDELLNAPLPLAGDRRRGLSEEGAARLDSILPDLDELPGPTPPIGLTLDPPGGSAFDFGGPSGSDVDPVPEAQPAPEAARPAQVTAPLSEMVLSTGAFDAIGPEPTGTARRSRGKGALGAVLSAARVLLFVALFVGLGVAGYVVVQRYLAQMNDDGFPEEGLTTEEVDTIGGTEARTLLSIMQGEGGPQIEELTDRPLGNLTVVQNITWEQREDATVVIIWADGRFTPTTTSYARLGEDPPREVVRILGVEGPYSPAEVIMEESPHVQYLRIGYHRGRQFDELHIIAELVEPAVQLKRFELDGSQLRLFFAP